MSAPTITRTIKPRPNRPLVHQVATMSRPASWGRYFARTLCGQKVSGEISATIYGSEITCKRCLELPEGAGR